MILDPQIQALIAKWRKESAINRSEIERVTDETPDDGESDALLARWNAYRKCADELEALALQGSPEQQKAEATRVDGPTQKPCDWCGSYAHRVVMHGPPSGECISEAHKYLARLLTHSAPTCEPLPDLLGVITQIDNLLVGLRRTEPGSTPTLPKQEKDASRVDGERCKRGTGSTASTD